MVKIIRILLTILLMIAVAPAAQARAEAPPNEAVSVFLIAGVKGVGELTSVPLGLDIHLASGWHTYWRSPGEAGLPPQINWSQSESDEGNLKSAMLLYPAPKRYMAFGLETIGYSDHVVLPIDAGLRMPGKPLAINATLDLLVCSQICLPKHFILKLTVPPGPAEESADAALIKQFRDKVPSDTDKTGLEVKNVASDGQNLVVDVASKDVLQTPDLFAESDRNIDFGAPAASVAADRHSVQFSVKPLAALPEGVTLAGLPLTLTITDGDRALQHRVVVPTVRAPVSGTLPQAPAIAEASEAAAPALPAPSVPALPFELVIIFAIIGGFILNLMPCVLPVLSLKLLSVINHGGGEARFVRQSFLVTAAGILFSFLALAGMTIALKELGLAVGWGVQFQQPVFLGLLVLLLTFFAANMWGLFEIRLPQWLAANLSGPYHPKLAGDFATGALATLLATPCTAPFLGTAVGFALASGPREILIIFMALGFGMTLPYLAVALRPRLATSLPHPGIWMMHLRHLLGWALGLTALWLIWVLAAQISERGAFVVGLCMLAIVGLFALQSHRPRSYIRFGVASFAILAFGITLTGSLAPKPIMSVDANWQVFDESALARDVKSGKTVFVDVTADWCLTCKANQKFVLSRDDIAQRLFHTQVIPMQANWTSPDPVIAAFLQKYGRFGIPFNIVFGPGAPQGLVLPELLLPQKVLETLDQAEKSPQS